MSEINNNIPNYGFKTDRIEAKIDNSPKQSAETPKEDVENNYVLDTGVLGRSQINSPRGGNIEKSVNEAVDMAKNQPVKMGASEAVHDMLFQQYKNAGLSESDAYLKALLAEEEFLNSTQGVNR